MSAAGVALCRGALEDDEHGCTNSDIAGTTLELSTAGDDGEGSYHLPPGLAPVVQLGYQGNSPAMGKTLNCLELIFPVLHVTPP